MKNIHGKKLDLNKMDHYTRFTIAGDFNADPEDLYELSCKIDSIYIFLRLLRNPKTPQKALENILDSIVFHNIEKHLVSFSNKIQILNHPNATPDLKNYVRSLIYLNNFN